MKWIIAIALLVAGAYFSWQGLDNLVSDFGVYTFDEQRENRIPKAEGWDAVWYTWPLSLLFSITVGCVVAFGAFIIARIIIVDDYKNENKRLLQRNIEIKQMAKQAYEKALSDVRFELAEEFERLESNRKIAKLNMEDVEERQRDIAQREQAAINKDHKAKMIAQEALAEAEHRRQQAAHAMRLKRSIEGKRDRWKAKCDRLSNKLDELRSELESQNNP